MIIFKKTSQTFCAKVISRKGNNLLTQFKYLINFLIRNSFFLKLKVSLEAAI